MVSTLRLTGASFEGGSGGASTGNSWLASFWNSKTWMACGLPSSRMVKSPFLRLSTSLPDLSRTVTSSTTRLLLAVNLTVGCCAAAAIPKRRILSVRSRMSEPEPQDAADGAHPGSGKGQAVIGCVYHRADAGVIDVVGEIGRLDARLDTAAVVARKHERPAEARVE